MSTYKVNLCSSNNNSPAALEKWGEEFKQKRNDNLLPQNNYVEEWWNVILEESSLSENQISHISAFIL